MGLLDDKINSLASDVGTNRQTFEDSLFALQTWLESTVDKMSDAERAAFSDTVNAEKDPVNEAECDCWNEERRQVSGARRRRAILGLRRSIIPVPFARPNPAMEENASGNQDGPDDGLQPIKDQCSPRRPFAHEPANGGNRVQPGHCEESSNPHRRARLGGTGRTNQREGPAPRFEKRS